MGLFSIAFFMIKGVSKLYYICTKHIIYRRHNIRKMTTITLKINERSNYGKALLELIKVSIEEKKVKQVIDEESPYNPEFVKMIKKSAASKERFEVDPNDIWGSLGLR